MTAPDVEARDEHDDLGGIPSPAATFRLHGHREPWRALVAAHDGGRLHHAWLLQGPRGIGKATAAFAFARRLLGAAESGDGPVSSPSDPVARQIAQGGHPNVLHVTRPPADRGDGFKGQITVEEIRRLKRFFRTTTSDGRWRVAIIDPADDMNRSAANALLKILEEPPERSVFLLTNHVPGRLLPTIRSRCRVLRFAGLGREELAAALGAMPSAPTEGEAAEAARLSEGSVRTAISLLSSGGLETDAQLGRIWQGRDADWTLIHSLADAVTQKGREAAYELLLSSIFRLLAEEAEAGLARRAPASRQMATLWMTEGRRLREGIAFNLDRKQLLLSFFRSLFAARDAGRDAGAEPAKRRPD